MDNALWVLLPLLIKAHFADGTFDVLCILVHVQGSNTSNLTIQYNKDGDD